MRQRRQSKGLWGPLKSSVHRAITLVIWEKAHCPLSPWVHQVGVSFSPLWFVWQSDPTQVSSCFTTERSSWSAGLEGQCGWVPRIQRCSSRLGWSPSPTTNQDAWQSSPCSSSTVSAVLKTKEPLQSTVSVKCKLESQITRGCSSQRMRTA